MRTTKSVLQHLMQASRAGDYQTVQELVTCPTLDVDNPDREFGRNALMLSVCGGHTDCSTLLLKHTTDINHQDLEGKTVLMHICEQFQPNMVGLFDVILSNKQLDLERVDMDGWTALHWSSVNGHIQLVKKIISKLSAETHVINVFDNFGRNSAMLAANRGSLEVLKFLLKCGETVDSVDTDGKSGLMLTARCGHDKCVTELHRRGASLDRLDSDGQSALFHAASNYHLKCVKTLLSLGCKLQYENYASVSVLSIISNDIPLVEVLLAAGCRCQSVTLVEFALEKDLVPLMEQCRRCIRDSLGRNSPRTNLFTLVDRLPLPRPLKKYLVFNVLL